MSLKSAGQLQSGPIHPDEDISWLHDLAVRCFNAVLRLQYSPYIASGDRHGLEALTALRDIVKTLPPLPLTPDPFRRKKLVKIGGVRATSAHAAGLALAKWVWDAVQLATLETVNVVDCKDGRRNRYSRIDQKLVKRAPTDGNWSEATWKKVCSSMRTIGDVQSDRIQELLALEWSLARQRTRPAESMTGATRRTTAAKDGPVRENRLSAEEILARADEHQKEAVRQQREREQRFRVEENCRQAVSTLDDCISTLFSAHTHARWNKEVVFHHRGHMRRIYECFIAACKTILEAKYKDRWINVDHAATYARYRRSFPNDPEAQCGNSYEWAKHVLDQGLKGELERSTLDKCWKKETLRRSLDWGRILIRGLAGLNQLEWRTVASPETPPQVTIRGGSVRNKTNRARPLEARDKWIYKSCRKRLPYKEIVSTLKKLAESKRWEVIQSVQGVRGAAIKYAKRHDLPAIPNRLNL
jgi:hypothetical protein